MIAWSAGLRLEAAASVQFLNLRFLLKNNSVQRRWEALRLTYASGLHAS
jgi:hypothetical protein